MSAIPQIVNYDHWIPQTENTLDLRLASSSDEKIMHRIILKKATEMGKNLEYLYTQSAYLSYESLVKLLLDCPNLKILNLSCSYKISEKSLAIIAQFKKLEELNLQFASYIPDINLDKLSTNRIANPSQDITDNGVDIILKGCPHLKKLDLSGTKVTNKTLEKIKNKEKLIFLRVHKCLKLKQSNIDSLAQFRPNLMIDIIDKSESDLAFSTLVKEIKAHYFIIYQLNGFKITIKNEAFEKQNDLINPAIFS